MKQNYLLLFFICVLFVIPNVVQAQIGTDQLYQRKTTGEEGAYDMDEFFRQLEDYRKDKEEEEEGIPISQQRDTTKNPMIERFMASPDELYKLGVPPDLIKQLEEYNAMQDTIQKIKEEVEDEREAKKKGKKDDKEKPDSLHLDDINDYIKRTKEELVLRALSLPEPNLYGHEFFRHSMLKIKDLGEEPRPPKNYKLGIGDEISVLIWGMTDYQRVFRIDEQGAINPPLIGRMVLRGMDYEKAQKIIKSKYAKNFEIEEEFIEVNVTHTRIVSVHFDGQVLNRGSYRFPAVTSVINGLVATDGPNQDGSVRNIYVMREGKVIHTIDIYEYLNNPESQESIFLEEHDRVIIPDKGMVVNVSGEIKRTHNYELKEGEGLEDLIRFAGGLKASAFTRTINIKRYVRNRSMLLDVNLDSLRLIGEDYPLQDGDSVFVYRVPDEPHNYVEVIGAVRVPGQYELRRGDRISDFLNKTEGLLDDADLSRGFVIRLDNDMAKNIIPFKPLEILRNPSSPDNITLQKFDTLQVLSKSVKRQGFYVRIAGAINQPEQYEFAEGMTLRDLLYMAGGLRREAANNRIEISRIANFSEHRALEDKDQVRDRIIMKRIDVNTDLTVNQIAANYELKPYDHVFVRVAADFQEQSTVNVSGEIIYPGEYTLLSKQERITSLIERTGGFTPYVFKQGARLYRARDSTGYVLLDLSKAFKKRDSKFNYILEPGDSVFIPKVKDYVTLKGAIRSFDIDTMKQIGVPYERGRRANYYINSYGAGFGRYAKRGRTFVRQPNGKIQKAKDYFFFRQYPKVEQGGIVFVDITDRKRKERQRRARRQRRDWSEAFDNVSGKIATLLTIILLARQTTN